MREVFLVPYKQPRPSSPNRCGIMASSEPPRRGAWVEHMTRSHRRRQLMKCVYICSMVGSPRGIVSYGFQWVLSLKRRLAMREVFLVLYKQPKPSSLNRCRIMASSEPPRRGAWVEHMARPHRRRQLMRCVHIRSMVGSP